MRRKRTLTLLEVVIALTLTSFLLTALLGGMSRLFSARSRLESAKEEILAKKSFHERLVNLFSHTVHLDSLEGKEMLLYLDNLIDKESAFCGKAEGRLFIQGNRLLFLLKGREKKEREELLLDGVSSFSIQFFDPHEAAYAKTWDKKKEALPPFVLVTLSAASFRGGPTAFAFFLPLAENVIVITPKAP
ncbi:MAG TPA: hypothetical protein DCY54_03625 [Parachlamydiales bacterium]|nr:MAG: hypothetical protein A2Z85_03975 [Chlamydiae bacterium GWA2_50_15]OGN71155.1 MAG: hypothetical protein A3G30_01950 [Chlamydiae bacterium RIFCSPLOWO2_12_FULL_49_12]HAZ15707.1 hypothetical protein [Parachlamydiales bacterium]HCJ83067.1 hypothetical protein [Parachlamydiales bacterium]